MPSPKTASGIRGERIAGLPEKRAICVPPYPRWSPASHREYQDPPADAQPSHTAVFPLTAEDILKLDLENKDQAINCDPL